MLSPDTRLTLLALLAGFTLACSNKESSSSSPELAPPGRALISAGRLGTEGELKAEAEVKASSGPVEMTLRLYKRRIQAETSDTLTIGSLWVQIELRNVGKKRIFAHEDFFFKSEPIPDKSQKTHGIYLEVTDAEGKPVDFLLTWDVIPDSIDLDREIPPRKMTPAQLKERAEVEALVAGWRKQGLSFDEVALKLIDYSRESGNKKDLEERLARDSVLDPGASIKSVANASIINEKRQAMPPNARSVFTEAANYYFEKPGKHRIRAVYNHQMEKLSRREREARDKESTELLGHPPPKDRWRFLDEPPEEWDVRFETPAIEFEVLP
ncbi:MAG: hypothetical protein A2V88_06635 [Elusimicrobia bacterium RBG_16_66_12]|nr:MAG: hypothetical protein A2V88_06635 [Elusimicrobia bacterium RBG_16_66_12]